MQCKGFLFDLDGTLVDSLPAVERAWCSWGDRFAIPHKDILDFIHGKQAITSLRHFMAGASEEDIQREFYALEALEASDTTGITALPGAIALLNYLDANEIPWAIVTSGSVPVASARHSATGLPTPKVFVTAEQVSKGKPEPDPYLLGAKLLGLPASECLVVEDAAAGVLSGLAAGCHVAAVNVPGDAPGLDRVDFCLSSLEQLVVEVTVPGEVVLKQRES
ncbi:phosphatase [Mangrovibacter sp. MFB070]|uniref:sugar phosphatase n=1 Tax=Mangrovibacter sp. MFB070 TaxID=1224318 RepID=UPI0004D9E833|nr:sugar phosphatase [Mangrovibacter sp. MFB070]KEA50044.1 phosphatase [Mangrovibacter sp. MFB070]